MAHLSYRDHLPQLDGELFLTDGGIETVLIFHRGLELPEFAAFDLLKDEAGTEALRAYYAPYAELARERGVGFVLESPTWRASPGWAAQIGYSDDELDAMNRKAIALMAELRARYANGAPVVISGCIGPQGDGYNPATLLTADAAQEYHATQIGTFRETEADMVTAITMTYAGGGDRNRPGRGGGGDAGGDLVHAGDRWAPAERRRARRGNRAVDAETDAAPAYYMVNCAHPTHFEGVLDARGAVDRPATGAARQRLDAAATPSSTRRPSWTPATRPTSAVRYAALRERLPQLNVLGGCCGTDERHVGEICSACLAPS